MSRRVQQRGFTLIEVMIAVAVLALMSSMAWYTVASTSQTRESAEKWQERNHEIRIAMNRMVRDIGSAYISSNEDLNQQERRTLFVGKSSGDVDDLRFSTLGHVVLWADANESEQTQIYYFAESDRKDPSKTNLLRREQRRLSDTESWSEMKADVDVLLRDIERVSFEYYDWKDQEWKDSWDSTKVDAQRGRLPLRVRIKVEVRYGVEGDDNRDTITYTTQARIMMQEELKF